MSALRFIWDENKNRSNQRKHGISFEEACRVFVDPFHLSVQDRIEGGEERWQTLGQVDGIAVILVAHTVINDNADDEATETIRIISARPATRRERMRYEND